MLKLTIFISLVLTGCVTPHFFVKENSRLTKVVVHTCEELSFRDIDTNEVAKRKSCSNKNVSVHDWEQFLNKNNNAVSAPEEEEDHE